VVIEYSSSGGAGNDSVITWTLKQHRYETTETDIRTQAGNKTSAADTGFRKDGSPEGAQWETREKTQ